MEKAKQKEEEEESSEESDKPSPLLPPGYKDPYEIPHYTEEEWAIIKE